MKKTLLVVLAVVAFSSCATMNSINDTISDAAQSVPQRISSATGADERAEQREEERRLEQEAIRETRLNNLQSQGIYSDAEIEAILDGRIFIGMSGRAAVESWRRPTKINTTLTAAGRSEQWVYTRRVNTQHGTYNRTWAYVYVDNGIVTTVQRL